MNSADLLRKYADILSEAPIAPMATTTTPTAPGAAPAQGAPAAGQPAAGQPQGGLDPKQAALAAKQQQDRKRFADSTTA